MAILTHKPTAVLIDGELVGAANGKTFPAENPATGDHLGEVPRCDAIDVARAVQAAERAFTGWRKLHPRERAEYLVRLADSVDADRERLLMLDVLDNGSPIREMKVDIDYGTQRLRYFAGLALEVRGHTMSTGHDRLNYTLREPWGVVARIIPFNHPIMFALARIGAPLVAGNVVIIKPSEFTSLSALALAEHVIKIFPPAVVQILTGFGPEVGDALVTHPEIRRLAVIGSPETGRRIVERAASVGIKEVTTELGGKNPILIWPDADLEMAYDGVMRGMRFNFQGQACGSTSRLLVHRDHYDDFVGGLVERLEALRVGDPLDQATDVGSLVSAPQLQKVLDYIQIGKDGGAELLTGGARKTENGLDKGFFVPPTLFSHVDPDSRLSREEIFGPVLAATPYGDYDEAIRICNNVQFGLTATTYTSDLALAHAFARDVNAGYVWVNDTQIHFHGTPFGGFRNSGSGKEESMEELDSYTQLKNVNVRFGTAYG